MASSSRKVKSILKKLKKSLKIPRTASEKKKYLVGQAKKMDRNPTKPERYFIKILKELNIEYRTQEIVGGKIYDFYIPSKNILVEVDGDYWHAHDTSIEDMNGMQRRSVKNDKMKDVIARGNGYEILRVWEHEILDEYETTKQKIAYMLFD